MNGEVMHSIVLAYSELFLFLSILVGSYGLATIILSVTATLVMFYPLRWASKVSGKESEFQLVITPQITKIKMESQGLEQHNRINNLYSRYSYHPIYAVRLIMGIFIQLPFLVLTFFMFKSLEVLDRESFLFIHDLNKPDGLLYPVGNLLPFVMTVVNLIAALFIPNFTRKDLTQAFFVSLIFFFLLYNEKSILLLFWTINNVILLMRNILSHREFQSRPQFNFKHIWLKLQLGVQRREVAVFFIVILTYSLVGRLIFNTHLNYWMTMAIMSLSLLALGGLCLFHLTLFFKGMWSRFNKINKKQALVSQGPRAVDVVLILFPLAVIVQYVVSNHELLDIYEQSLLLAFSAIFLFLFVWLLPFLLQKVVPAVWLVPVSLVLSLLFTSMPTLVVLMGWAVASVVDFYLTFTTLILLFGISSFLYRNRISLLLSLSVLFFSFSAIYTGYITSVSAKFESTGLGSAGLEFKGDTEVNHSNFIASKAMQKKPDVYLLTYDSYVPSETMKQHGIDNSAQEKFLTSKGFKLYPKTYSIKASSLSTMSRVFEMSDSLYKPPVSSVAGNSLVNKIFKNEGYETYGILNPYLLNTLSSGYDVSYPELNSGMSVGMSSMITGLKEGRFRFDIVQRMSVSHEEWVEKKRSIFTAQTEKPKFMYTHATIPGHAQSTGVCREHEVNIFERNLNKSNAEMKLDIELILSSNRDAVIIVNGDHGPRLTGDCSFLNEFGRDEVTRLHLQDRYGSFLAIRWPDSSYKGIDDIRILQDVFESVFKYLFESENVLSSRVPTITLQEGSGALQVEGAVVDGRITLGADKGASLYE